METTTIYALVYKGNLIELAKEKACDFLPEFVKQWALSHTSYTGQAAINVGKALSDARIGPQFGTDPETVAVARGKAIATEILQAWDLEASGAALPVTPENIGLLPPIVLKQFGRIIELGLFPTEDELTAMKVPLENRSPSSSKAA